MKSKPSQHVQDTIDMDDLYDDDCYDIDQEDDEDDGGGSDSAQNEAEDL